MLITICVIHLIKFLLEKRKKVFLLFHFKKRTVNRLNKVTYENPAS